ncbi:Uncharacterised protein [Mycobacteroides abscessus subsp. abscessus]|nr:Uncharacterised protein [Mycobacteroides abscessus subsp. abscessus]SHY79583.1 Uncharacterised protein [Mycobacteroides abscessus subsp. abscessus]SIA48064.1 Uncharacterised protein [Mycobacteroides abscessus subsp. abscessus]
MSWLKEWAPKYSGDRDAPSISAFIASQFGEPAAESASENKSSNPQKALRPSEIWSNSRWSASR